MKTMREYMPFFLEHYVREVVKMIITKYSYNEKNALREFLNSKTYRMLANYKMEMWEFGYPAIFEIWECEKTTGDALNSPYLNVN